VISLIFQDQLKKKNGVIDGLIILALERFHKLTHDENM